MFSVKQRRVSPPCPFAPIHWPLEPVAPLKRERSALFAKQPPPHRIFPVSSVNHNFPNVMPPGPGRQRRLARRNAANRTAKVGPMPCSLVVSFIQQSQEILNFQVRHCFSRCFEAAPGAGSRQYSRGLKDNRARFPLIRKRECSLSRSTPHTDHLVGGLACFPVASLFAEVQVR
jgi:hypothetical protein